jgi:hypothetical protein
MEAPLVLASARGKNPSIINEGRRYSFQHEAKDLITTWRCSKYPNCKATMKTNPGHNLVVMQAEHACEVSDHQVERHKLRVACKQKAEGDMHAIPSKIIKTEIRTLADNNLRYEDITAVRRSIYRKRFSTLGSIPKSKLETHEALEAKPPTTANEASMLLENDVEAGIIIFATRDTLDSLETFDFILADGTFKSAPKYFGQLYSIHGYRNGWYIPLIFCVLSDKSRATYDRMWQLIKHHCPHLHPTEMSMDFEKAAMLAAEAAFPNIQIRGCRFHLGQAWWRRIQDLGLAKHYKCSDSEIGKWLTYFNGLAFLRPMEVQDAFVELFAIMPDNQRCNNFADYVLNNYIEGEFIL